MSRIPRLGAGLLAGLFVALAIPNVAAADPIEQWWADAYRLDEVHQTTQGEGSIVCVIDGAINADVPEFDGADLQLKSASVGGELGYELGPAKSYTSEFYAAHGTSMSSLIIGQGTGTGPGGSGIAGMAPKATVFFYGVNSNPTDRENPRGAFDALVNRGLDDGCELFSISYTGISLRDNTLQRANEAQAIILTGGPIDPGALSEELNATMVVGAAAQDSQPWTDDKQPEFPDVLAPGVDIVSGGNEGTATDARWDSTIVNSGSSDATAITAGMLALVKSKYPEATGNQLIQSLLHSVGGGNNWAANDESGWGPTSLKDMLARDPSGWPDVNPMLMSRQEIYDAFPESAWQDPNAPAAEDEDRAEASAEAATTSPSDDNAIPVWAWGVGALALIGAAGTTVVLARRRSTTSSTGTGA